MNSSIDSHDHEERFASDDLEKNETEESDQVGREAERNQVQRKRALALRKNVARQLMIENVDDMDLETVCRVIDETEATIMKSLRVGTCVYYEQGDKYFYVSSADFTKHSVKKFRTVELYNKASRTYDRIPLHFFVKGYYLITSGPVDLAPPPVNSITALREMFLRELRRLLKDTIVDDASMRVASMSLAQTINKSGDHSEERICLELEGVVDKLRSQK